VNYGWIPHRRFEIGVKTGLFAKALFQNAGFVDLFNAKPQRHFVMT